MMHCGEQRTPSLTEPKWFGILLFLVSFVCFFFWGGGGQAPESMLRVCAYADTCMIQLLVKQWMSEQN